MPKKSRTPSETAAAALLDVDWLSGKRADPRFRLPKGKSNSSMLGTTLSVTALFVVVVSAIGLWTPLSQRWLRENGLNLINLGSSSVDDTLAMMVSLNELAQTSERSEPSIPNAGSADVGTASYVATNPQSSVVQPVLSATLASSRASARLSDEYSVPPPPMNSDSFSLTRLSDNDSSEIIKDSRIERVVDADVEKLPAKSVEFKRYQSKPAVVVPVEQIVAESNTKDADSSPNDDLKRLSVDRLFSLLASTQERRVRLVCDELSQRGVPNSLLELAVQLARSDEAQQLELLDRLSRASEVNPTSVLCWMAQSGRKAVRRRAIAILGSLQDRDVVQQLRYLATREPDSSLRQLIEQTVASNFGAIH